MGILFAIDKNASAQKKILRLDLTNKSEVDLFIKDNNYFDVLIFLVGLAHTKGSHGTQKEHKKINYQTLFNLLEIVSARVETSDYEISSKLLI